MHAALLFPREYICAADLHGKDVTLTISKLVQEDLRTDQGDEAKWVVHFQEMEERHKKDRKKLAKRLVLNKTNAKAISKALGTETNDWVGKRIVLYPTTCQAFGETVDCVRVREKAGKKSSGATEPDPAGDAVSTAESCGACGGTDNHQLGCPEV